MPKKLLTLDFYNDSFYIADGDFEHLWTVKDNFLSTGFPFKDNIAILSYEPMRNFYAVEYYGGRTVNYKSEEIEWVEVHFDLLLQSAKDEKNLLENPVLSIQQMREIKLYETDWMVIRHQEQLLAGDLTTLSELQFDALVAYRRWIRELPLTYPDVDMNARSDSIVWADFNLGEDTRASSEE